MEKKSIVSGEDLESEEEEFDDCRQTPTISISNSNAATAGNSSVKIVTFGEAPESDIEFEDFGSTVSLESSANSFDEVGLLKLDPEDSAVLAPILPQRRSPRLDPSVVRKHREKNKSLRMNISEKFLTPVINQSAKKFDKLSQNLSNSQMQMQDALFQSRIATGNLLKLQKELENFLEVDYLRDLKILPSDEDATEVTEDESTIAKTSIEDLSSNSILTAALSGGAHII